MQRFTSIGRKVQNMYVHKHRERTLDNKKGLFSATFAQIYSKKQDEPQVGLHLVLIAFQLYHDHYRHAHFITY